MRPIEKYVEAMENKDFAGLAELFTPDGILCDYCTTSASQAEFIANFGGYNIMAIATVRKTDENGLIQRLTVRPK